MKLKLAVIAFPGNNCEIETLRAGARGGFETTLVRWNEDADLSVYDAFVLPGGFSFEDRGRSGVVSSREKIFDRLRKAAQKGKVVLGICNGAQMLIESGLIPVGKEAIPFALAQNIRRDDEGRVVGDGFFNTWVHIAPERRDTAFTCTITKSALAIPIAHGEGRFTSVNKGALGVLENGKQVAFRYCDETGNVSPNYPTTPNGALFATAGIVNKEGTVCAMMPHPERFFDACDGGGVFASMYAWVKEGRSPEKVNIGDLTQQDSLAKPKYTPSRGALLLEKKDIITDNEAFTISRTANQICGNDVKLEKTVLFEVMGNVSQEALLETGLLLNPNKEALVSSSWGPRYGIRPREDDTASHLSERLSSVLKIDIKVNILKIWDFSGWEKQDIETIIDNNLLANPHSAEVFEI